MNLLDQHVFVSGGGKRLGRALSERLLDEGAHLTTTYRSSKSDTESLVETAKAKGRKAQCFFLDLGQPKTFQTTVDSAVANYGPVKVIINCASDFFPTPLMKVTADDWNRLMTVNLESHFFLVQAFLKTMKEGVIINLVDINAEKPLKNFTPYTISKAGLLMMTRNLALELSPKIRVNGISPGPVLLPEHFTEEQTERAKETTLLNRLGSPQDIVEAALFLIENDYVTGMNLKVDGGASLK